MRGFRELLDLQKETTDTRGGSRTAVTSKMELFVIIVKDFQPLTIITKCSILDVAAVLDPPVDTTEISYSVRKTRSKKCSNFPNFQRPYGNF